MAYSASVENFITFSLYHLSIYATVYTQLFFLIRHSDGTASLCKNESFDYVVEQCYMVITRIENEKRYVIILTMSCHCLLCSLVTLDA